MPRRGYKRKLAGSDILYESNEIAKLINYVMVDGKKTVAQKVVYNALELIKKENMDPQETLKRAIGNVGPTHEVRPRRVGGASYLVPTETRQSRRIFLAFNWIIQAAKSRSSREYNTFDKKLAAELIEAVRGEGEAVSKKRQVEKLAEANKAFAHFRW